VYTFAGLGRVIVSSDESKFPVGSYITAMGGLAEYLTLRTQQCTPVATDCPLSWNLGPLFFGMGHTAWIGNKICAIKPGETYVISGGAGAVGTIAGQLAKMAGARVIGIAGGPAKCRFLTEELGFDGAVDYKTDDVESQLDRLCPNGIDCYFDNVGGDILDYVLARMNCFGRIAFCGAISMYSGDLMDGESRGPKNYKMIFMRRLKVQGFICRDHAASKKESEAEIVQGIKEGKIRFKEDIKDGRLEEYVATLNLLFTGGNTGKLILKIAD
jgi:NADPH-dependent curcumin reductase CurA